MPFARNKRYTRKKKLILNHVNTFNEKSEKDYFKYQL